MKLKKNKNLINFFILSLIIIIILKFFNAPYNLYSILNWNYENRMEQAYGNCKNESWGFYNTVNKKFNLKNEDIKIINDDGFVTIEFLFGLKKNNFIETKYFILLNYNSENDDDIFNSKKYKFIKNYKVKYRYNNCYLMELND